MNQIRIFSLILLAIYGCKAFYNKDFKDISEVDDNSPAALSRFNFPKDYPNSDENVEESDREQDIFQETDVFGLRRKKSQTLCRVKKVLRNHNEAGYEFYPKHYSEYECVPFDGDATGSEYHNLDTCSVHRGKCVPVQKFHFFMKTKIGENCWSLQKTVVSAGCKCISPVLEDN